MAMGRSLGCTFNLVALVASLCLYALDASANQDVQWDEITFGREKIFVNVSDGPTLIFLVELEESGWQLRAELHENEGIPYERMQLKMGDTLMNYTMQLSDYNISARATVNLEIPEDKNGRLVEFSVKTLDGRELPVSTQLGNSVASLKENITRWAGIPKVEQRLLLKGRELKDERKLAQYAIYNRTVVNLGGPLADCRRAVTVVIKTLSGATIKVEVDLADTVNDLKKKIWESVGVPVGVQRLFANERVIAGADHLCDLGLEAGSTVYMILYSSRITSLEQVARLREPPVKPDKAPIFREVDGVVVASERERNRRATLYRDQNNWVPQSDPLPGWEPRLFDPAAHLAPNPDDEQWVQRNIRDVASLSDGSESDRLEAETMRMRVKLSTAVRPYRVAANLTSDNYARDHPGITLGGGFDDVRPEQLVHLGADVNNWAPDNFSDSDLMRLFEVAERVRQVLARAAQTGEGNLSIARQKQINNEILFSYLEALAGHPVPVEYNQPSEGEECGICRDDLTAEPDIKLACEHAFHADCILSWATNLYRAGRFPSCPSCRRRFKLPYEGKGKAELKTEELHQVE